jgi:hypothetical protein
VPKSCKEKRYGERENRKGRIRRIYNAEQFLLFFEDNISSHGIDPAKQGKDFRRNDKLR